MEWRTLLDALSMAIARDMFKHGNRQNAAERLLARCESEPEKDVAPTATDTYRGKIPLL
jgi:hypothetical protein